MDGKQQAEDLRSFFKMEKIKLKKLKTMYKEQFESDHQELETMETALIVRIKEEIQSLKNDMSSSYDKIRIEIEDAISRMDNQIAEFDDLVKPEYTTSDSEINAVISKTNVTHAILPMETLQLNLLAGLRWISNPFLRLDLASCVKTSLKDKIGVFFTESFETGLRSIDFLSSHTEGTVWLNSEGNKIVRKVELGDNLIIVKDVPSILVRGIAVMTSGDILLSIVSEPVIKIHTTAGEIKDFFTFKHTLGSQPQVAFGMHAVNTSTVIVCTMEKNGSNYKLKEMSHRQIIVLNVKEGRKVLQKTIEYDDTGSRLFTFPYRVVSLKNGNICVIDRLSENHGQVISLSKNGKLHWTFDENEDARDISATKTDILVICSSNKHSILLLDNTGHLLHRCNLRAKFDIRHPCSLSIDSKDRLLVGCSTKFSKAKMHVLEFRGGLDDIFW